MSLAQAMAVLSGDSCYVPALFLNEREEQPFPISDVPNFSLLPGAILRSQEDFRLTASRTLTQKAYPMTNIFLLNFLPGFDTPIIDI